MRVFLPKTLKTMSIQPTDLRIGNWANFTFYGVTKQRKVYGVIGDSVYVDEKTTYEISMVSAIELTEEIFIKCGFKKIWSCWRLGPFSLAINFDKSSTRYFYTSNCFIEVKYLHQLQNLYHVLTGQELEVNL